MNLAPTDEQQAVMEAARRLLTRDLTRESRATWDESGAGADASF